MNPERQRQRLEMADLFRYPTGVDRETLWLQLDHARWLIKKGHGGAEHWLKRANCEYHLGVFTESHRSAEEACRAEPGNAEAHFLRGLSLQLLARDGGGAAFPQCLTEKARHLLASAREAFVLVLLLNPHDDEARHHLNLCATLLGETAAEAAAE